MNWLLSLRSAIAFISFGVVLIAGSAVVDAEPLDKGHRILLEKGLQIQAQVFWEPSGGFDLPRWRQSNFTTVNWQWKRNLGLLGAAPGIPWGSWTDNEGKYDAPTGGDQPYLSNLVSLQLSDEQDLNDPAVRAAAADWFDRARGNFPDTLLFTNQCNSRVTVENMRLYMKGSQPDMLCFDTYPFGEFAIANPAYGSPRYLYQDMAAYRQLGLEGNDGSGQRPIPYGMYLQTFKSGGNDPNRTWKRFPSESEMRLNQSAAWAFGFTFASAFTYNAPDSEAACPSLFTGLGDTAPTFAFDQIAEINRQSANLGSALVRLVSTDLRMKMGSHWTGTEEANALPTGVTPFSTTADRYLTGVSARNLGTLSHGLPGDVILGFFKPLDPSLVAEGSENDVYFMLVNGLTDAIGTAVDCRQSIHLDFDFGTSGIDSLLRLNRDTGLVEEVALTHEGGSFYSLDLTLDGGTGDLFKYNTGTAFVPEPSAVSMCIACLMCGFVLYRRMAKGRERA